MKNKKGFTLIELLAVIVILAILLAIALPQVTQYITRSRKDSLVATARDFTDAVRNAMTGEIYELPVGTDDITLISVDLVKLEKGGKKSPFNAKWLPKYSYVAVVNVGTDEDPDYEYFIAIRDSKRYTIALTKEENINRESIVRSDASGSKAHIDSICGSKDGTFKIINHITGLEQYTPPGGWNAIVYSSGEC